MKIKFSKPSMPSPVTVRRFSVIMGLSLLAFGIGAFDWRISAIVMGLVFTLAGAEVL